MALTLSGLLTFVLLKASSWFLSFFVTDPTFVCASVAFVWGYLPGLVGFSLVVVFQRYLLVQHMAAAPILAAFLGNAVHLALAGSLITPTDAALVATACSVCWGLELLVLVLAMSMYCAKKTTIFKSWPG